jgi:hypothetical protein
MLRAGRTGRRACPSYILYGSVARRRMRERQRQDASKCQSGSDAEDGREGREPHEARASSSRTEVRRFGSSLGRGRRGLHRLLDAHREQTGFRRPSPPERSRPLALLNSGRSDFSGRNPDPVVVGQLCACPAREDGVDKNELGADRCRRHEVISFAKVASTPRPRRSASATLERALVRAGVRAWPHRSSLSVDVPARVVGRVAVVDCG